MTTTECSQKRLFYLHISQDFKKDNAVVEIAYAFARMRDVVKRVDLYMNSGVRVIQGEHALRQKR